MLLTCASRYSKCGHRKTVAGFEFRSSSPSRSKATSCVRSERCAGTLLAAMVPPWLRLLQLRPGQHPRAVFLQCLLLKRTSSSCLFQHLPRTKIKFITLMLVSHGLQLQLMKCISIQVLLPASEGTGFHAFTVLCQPSADQLKCLKHKGVLPKHDLQTLVGTLFLGGPYVNSN